MAYPYAATWVAIGAMLLELSGLTKEYHCTFPAYAIDNVIFLVIMLTANAVAGAREQYLAKGFYGFLAKPVAPEKLEESIRKFLPDTLVNLSVHDTLKEDSQNVRQQNEDTFEENVIEKI